MPQELKTFALPHPDIKAGIDELKTLRGDFDRHVKPEHRLGHKPLIEFVDWLARRSKGVACADRRNQRSTAPAHMTRGAKPYTVLWSDDIFMLPFANEYIAPALNW